MFLSVSKTQCVSNVSIYMEYESAVDHLMAMHYTRKYINLHFTYDRLTEKTHPPFHFPFQEHILAGLLHLLSLKIWVIKAYLHPAVTRQTQEAQLEDVT